MKLFGKCNAKKITVIAVCAVISGLLLIFALQAYPVPAGDSMFFLAPAVQFAKSGDLANPIDPVGWPIMNAVDPSGMKRFLFHPPLFQLVLNFLMPEASPQGALIAVSFINIAVVWFTALLLYKGATRKTKLHWRGVGVIAAALVALAASLTETGRPEIVGRLWVVLGALVLLYVPKKYNWIPLGILLGLMFATHAAAGVFSIFIVGLALSIALPFREIVVKGSAMLCIAFFTALGGILLGPYGIRETIEGAFAYAMVIMNSIGQEGLRLFTLSNLLNYYIFSQAAPFYGLVVLLLFISGVFLCWKYRKRVASPLVAGICAIAIAYSIGKIMYTIGHTYYITLFAPVICLVFVYFFFETKRVGQWTTILVFALVATGFARTALLFPFFIQQGQGLKEARAHIAKVIQPYENENVEFGIGGGSGGGAWYFFDDYKNVYPYVLPEKPKEKTALIVVQQRYSGKLTPPEVPGCAIKDDAFSKETPKMFGIKLGNTMPGYGYAVYDCLKK